MVHISMAAVGRRCNMANRCSLLTSWRRHKRCAHVCAARSLQPTTIPAQICRSYIIRTFIIRTSKVTPSIVPISREDDIIIYSGGRIETGAAQDIVKPENQNKDNLETSEFGENDWNKKGAETHHLVIVHARLSIGTIANVNPNQSMSLIHQFQYPVSQVHH